MQYSHRNLQKISKFAGQLVEDELHRRIWLNILAPIVPAARSVPHI